MSSDEESTGSYESHDEDSASEEEIEPPKPVAKKRGNGKKKKDPNRPKRNMSVFFLYSNANRARVKEENPGIPFGQVVSRRCRWLCGIALF